MSKGSRTRAARAASNKTLKADVSQLMSARQWNLLAVMFDQASWASSSLEDALAIKKFIRSIVDTEEFRKRLEEETKKTS